jgi:hypothetical protein
MKSFLKFATRPDNLVLVICLCLFAAVVAHGENGPTPKIVVGSSGISDGSVTNAKLAEPVSVANGGTGKTTAAEALAALGGASLNGSSTVDFAAQRSTVSNQVINTDGYSRTSGSFSYSAVIGTLASSAAYNIDFNLASNGGFFAETLTNLQFNSGKQAGGCWYSTAVYNVTTGLSGLVTQQTVDLDDSQLLAVTWSQPAANTLRLTLTNNHTATIYVVAIMVRIVSDRAGVMTFKSKG